MYGVSWIETPNVVIDVSLYTLIFVGLHRTSLHYLALLIHYSCYILLSYIILLLQRVTKHVACYSLFVIARNMFVYIIDLGRCIPQLYYIRGLRYASTDSTCCSITNSYPSHLCLRFLQFMSPEPTH